jgi:hypothetical protein
LITCKMNSNVIATGGLKTSVPATRARIVSGSLASACR